MQKVYSHQPWPEQWKTVLYDLKEDPKENHPFRDEKIEAPIRQKMVRLMLENDAPAEQYERMGLQKEYREQK